MLFVYLSLDDLNALKNVVSMAVSQDSVMINVKLCFSSFLLFVSIAQQCWLIRMQFCVEMIRYVKYLLFLEKYFLT